MRRRVAVLALWLTWAGGMLTAAAQTPSPLARGSVKADSGQWVAGARVTVEEVGELHTVGGTDLLVRVPSALLGQSTRTDEAGGFAFTLPTHRTRLRVSVLADGFEPGWAELEPDRPAEVALRTTLPEDALSQVIRIRVKDRAGQPIAGACLRVDAVYDLRDRTRLGEPGLVDQTGVSDESGEIRLRSRVSGLGVSGWLSKPGYATENLTAYTTGVPGREGVEEIDRLGSYTPAVLGPGESLRGELRFLDATRRPMPPTVIEVARVLSNPRHFDLVRVLTREDGSFDLPPVVPYGGVRMYARMGQSGASPARGLIAGFDDPTVHGFGLLIADNHRLTGRLVLDGTNEPQPNVRVRLERIGGWDSLEAVTDSEGRFVMEGVPAETPLRLSIAAEGLILSGRHPNFSVLYDCLIGRVEKDLVVTIPLVRGRRPPLTDLSRETQLELRQAADALESLSLQP